MSFVSVVALLCFWLALCVLSLLLLYIDTGEISMLR